jgi:phosphoglycerol transferase
VSLVVVAALIWVAHYDRWTPGSWRYPTEYAGDTWVTLTRLQAAAEGDTWPMTPQIIERLGAPFGARWNAFPAPDKPLMLALGGLARITDVYVAANVGVLLAQVLGVLAFYFVARYLRARWEWAWVGALLFAFTYYTFHRGLGHFSLTFTWTVPLGLLAVGLVARSHRLAWRTPEAALCLGIAAVLGAHNPYNLFFWLQLMGWALVAQWLGARRRANLAVGAATIAVSLVVFAAMHSEGLFIEDKDAPPLMARNYAGTEIYALKPVEMFVPPKFHRLEPLAFFGARYQRWTDWRGEEFVTYLGICGIAALFWLGWVSVRRLLRGRAPPAPALGIGWLFAFSTIGGITNLMAFYGGLQIFRATNRAAIFVSTLVLLFAVVRLSRLSMRWPRTWCAVVAFGVAAVGVLDQVPREDTPAEQAELRRLVDADRDLGRRMEAALPRGAAVFQLPVVGFPEETAPARLASYEHFRPYLNTTHLRFSFGFAKLRARSRWQREVEAAPAPALVRQLENAGFAALFINRKGFENRAENLLKQLEELGYRRRLEGLTGNQVVVFLNPSTRPEPPMSRNPSYGRGWYPRVLNGVRWAHGDATLAYYNPHAHDIEVEIRLRLRAPELARLTLRFGGREVGALVAGPEPGELRITRLRLGPGVNRFELVSDRLPKRLSTGRYELRAFGLDSAFFRLLGENR